MSLSLLAVSRDFSACFFHSFRSHRFELEEDETEVTEARRPLARSSLAISSPTFLDSLHNFA